VAPPLPRVFLSILHPFPPVPQETPTGNSGGLGNKVHRVNLHRKYEVARSSRLPWHRHYLDGTLRRGKHVLTDGTEGNWRGNRDDTRLEVLDLLPRFLNLQQSPPRTTE
jgi:hypothetical protein